MANNHIREIAVGKKSKNAGLGECCATNLQGLATTQDLVAYIETMAERMEAVADYVETLERDAERYRFLRSKWRPRPSPDWLESDVGRIEHVMVCTSEGGATGLTEEELDSAVDDEIERVLSE